MIDTKNQNSEDETRACKPEELEKRVQQKVAELKQNLKKGRLPPGIWEMMDRRVNVEYGTTRPNHSKDCRTSVDPARVCEMIISTKSARKHE